MDFPKQASLRRGFSYLMNGRFWPTAARQNAVVVVD